MLSYADVQIAYNDLYREVRRYIWSFPAVEALADLEISIYQTCPNIPQVRINFYRFRSFAVDLLKDDAGLKAAFDVLQDLIESEDTTYAKLNQVKEVV